MPTLPGSPLPHDYSTITAPSLGEPVPGSLHGGGQRRSEEVLDLEAVESETAATTSHIDPAPVEGFPAQDSPQAPTLETGQLGPSSQALESDSVCLSSSIPSPGPDLLGPEPKADSKTVMEQSSGDEHATPPSQEGSSDDVSGGSSSPSADDEVSRGDDSELNKPGSNGNTRDVNGDTSGLDSQSRTAESSSSLASSSVNGMEQIPQPDNIDVIPEPPPDGVRDGGGGGRRGNAPLGRAHPSGMGSGGVRSDQYQTDSIDDGQSTDSSPAASPSSGDTVTDSGGNMRPSDLDGIPANSGSAEINGESDLDSLGDRPLHSSVHLPSDAPSDTENAGPAADGLELVGAEEVGGPGSITSSKGGDDFSTDVGGNETGADFRSENGNLTGVDASGKVGVGVNASQGGSAQNGTDTAPSRNGNHTGNGGSGLGNGLPGQQKEKSVFLRLSNHIDEMDKNMTLFGIFLDQISARYGTWEGGRSMIMSVRQDVNFAPLLSP